MKILWPLSVVVFLVSAALLGAQDPLFRFFLAVVVPYAAAAIFLAGLVGRVRSWARSPVPFRIPTTCGQQRSLPWIRSARLDNPSTGLGAALRVMLEVVAFRSLFRNTKASLRPDGRLVQGGDKLLWLGALAMHASFTVILLRHGRFFFDPVPAFVLGLQALDGFFAVGVPEVYLTGAIFLGALLFLLGRRLLDDRLRYLSLPADFLPLFLLLGVAGSGLLLRHLARTDLLAVKTLILSLVRFHPAAPVDAGSLFYVHLLLVCALAAYFPFSKLMHMAGVFLSPTRNLANDNRARRHLNPWNGPVSFHTYEQWEDDFRDKLTAAGFPVDKERG
jgi:nitrate reductase gamma subunit